MLLAMSSKKASANNQDNAMDVAQMSLNEPQAMAAINANVLQGFQIDLTPLTEAELRSRYTDITCSENAGIVLQFINNNCPGASTLIGGIRLVMRDVRKIPAYLSKYESQVKERALFALKRHFIENQCALGATENLCPDDFGMSYSVASVSAEGLKLNPTGRHEGPLMFCFWNNLVTPTKLQTFANGAADYAYVINVYINLLPASQRRAVVIRKAKEDEARELLDRAERSDNRGKKLRYNSPYSRESATRGLSFDPIQVVQENQAMQNSIVSMDRELKRLREGGIPTPELVPTAPLVWPPPNNMVTMPTDV
jgi:hypothetical protein